MKVPIITQPLSGKKKQFAVITTNKRVQYWGKTDNARFPTHYVEQILNMVTPRHDRALVGFSVVCEYWE